MNLGGVGYQFGPFHLDPAERLLTNQSQAVALTPKAFDVLVYLVEHHGRLVEKSTLMTALWPDTIVEEANLAFQISALRKALGDSEDLIQTVPTKGYRFVGEVTRAPIAKPKTKSAPGLLIVLGVAAVLVALTLTAYLLTRSNAGHASTSTQPPVRLLPVTTLTGWQDWPSLSPDGNQVAFEWAGDRNDNHDIYVTLVGSRDVRRLTTHPDADFAPTWSPNGREIAFLRTTGPGATRFHSTIHVVSALGGPDRKISEFPAWATPAWSPDSRFIVLGRMTDRDQDRGIYLVPVSGEPPRPIERLRTPAEAHAPALSADGRRLAYARCETVDQEGDSLYAERGSQGCYLMIVDIDDAYRARGAPRALTRTSMATLGGIAWSRDGRTLLFWARQTRPIGAQVRDDDEFTDHLWRISADDPHAPERVELAGLNARRPTTSRSRDRLVFSRGDTDADVYRLVRGRAPERLLTSAFLDGHSQFSSDGRRIAFCSDRTGASEIYVADADGSSVRQLTRGPTEYQGSPRWSPDGSIIAFDSQEISGDRHIWTSPPKVEPLANSPQRRGIRPRRRGHATGNGSISRTVRRASATCGVCLPPEGRLRRSRPLGAASSHSKAQMARTSSTNWRRTTRRSSKRRSATEVSDRSFAALHRIGASALSARSSTTCHVRQCRSGPSGFSTSPAVAINCGPSCPT